jgi:hypothetical protein
MKRYRLGPLSIVWRTDMGCRLGGFAHLSRDLGLLSTLRVGYLFVNLDIAR